MSDDDKNKKDDFEDDLDMDDFADLDDDEVGFDDYGSQGTLGDLWRNNPLVKAGAVIAVIALIVAIIILFGPSDDRVPVSAVGRGADLAEAPGTSEISETYRQAIDEFNVEQVEQALQTGESALPIPTDPQRGRIPLQIEDETQEDPLERWRRLQEERIRQQQLQEEEIARQVEEEGTADDEVARNNAVTTLAQAMSRQMEAVLENQQIEGPQSKVITTISYLDALNEKRRLAAEEAAAGAGDVEEVSNIILPAGEIVYAQMITEANTDAPGPILAQIVVGPLRGSRLIGDFESTDNYLTLNFNTIVVDGISQGVSAVALDPDTTLPGIVTDIDRRYFQRVVLPMAAEFIEGFTEAVSDSGTTTVTINNETVTEQTQDRDTEEEVASGIAEAGEALAEILEDQANSIEPLLRVEAGTPIGIFFLEPVVEGGNSVSEASGDTITGNIGN